MLKIRKAQMEDCLGIYEIRNDEEVLCHFFETKPVSYEQHENWFKNSLMNPNRILYVIHLSHELAGVVRFDLDQNGLEAEVGIHVAKNLWGKGIGPIGLTKGEELFLKDFPNCKKIRARVKIDNEASLKLFKKCTYEAKTIILEKALL